MFQELARLAGYEFPAHEHCYLGLQSLIWLHVTSDLLIGLSYVAISLTLAYLVYRIRNPPFYGMFLAFGVFIISCGLTHFLSVLVVWDGRYWLEGFVKVVTAASSVGTALLLPPLVPKALALIRTADHAELERLYRQAQQLDRLKTEFFANVSHELRTPLTLVIGPTERLLADEDLTPEQRRALETVALNGRTLLKHVNDLLDVARLEAKRVAMHYADTDLARLARLAAAHFEALAQQRGVRLTVEAPASLPAQVDATKVESVLLNLLANAFKFVPDGGRVRVSLRAEDGRAVLDVADSGPGVPPEVRGAVFERFLQGAGEAGRRRGGSGLGLAIAREFVELHGGAITVGDAPEGGALFVVSLPLRAPAGVPVELTPPEDATADRARQELAALQPRPAETGARPGTGEGLVLVVEDNPDMRQFIAESLAGEFQVATAGGGKEGLAKALELRPDLVLSDVMMSESGGDDLVRQVRARRELDGVPVVLLTAKADDELRVRLLREGASDYLIKPFVPEELRARVGNLVTLKRAADVLRREAVHRDAGLELLAHEVTLHKRAADTARAQAEHATRVKSHFLRMVSHELRTPLTPLVLHLGTLRRDRESPLTPRQHVLATKIGESAERLRGLINSIIEYSDLLSARPLEHVATFDAAALAAEVLAAARAEAERKGLALRLAVPDRPAPLHSDPRLVRLVLAKLVNNAVKFTERGEVTVTLTPAEGGVALAVRDTGPGIPPDRQEKVFEPFEHVEPVEHKHTPGVGLGLAVVKAVVQSLGGHVELESQPGTGSTFTLVLPSLDGGNGTAHAA